MSEWTNLLSLAAGGNKSSSFPEGIPDENTIVPQVEKSAEDDRQESQQSPDSRNERSELSLISTIARDSGRALHGGQSSSSDRIYTPLGTPTRFNFDFVTVLRPKKPANTRNSCKILDTPALTATVQ